MKTQKSDKIVIAGESSRRWMIQERSPFGQGWQHIKAVIGQHGQDPQQGAHPLFAGLRHVNMQPHYSELRLNSGR